MSAGNGAVMNQTDDNGGETESEPDDPVAILVESLAPGEDEENDFNSMHVPDECLTPGCSNLKNPSEQICHDCRLMGPTFLSSIL